MTISPNGYSIERLNPQAIRAAAFDLADILIDCVEGGASVNFMRGLDRIKAHRFWIGVADHAVIDGRAVLAAMRESDRKLVGTVQMVPVGVENQPHRAEITKMLVMRSARRNGLGTALMQAAEAAALKAGRKLLTLDTASDDAERLYAALGWTRVGRIPDYALMPDGQPCAATFFYKALDQRV